MPENTGPATWHFAGLQISFISPPGDFPASPVMPVSSTTLARFWLAGVDVTASEHTRVIVALGESIVDGAQSTVDANARWTDQLARRLLAQPGHPAVGVLNEDRASVVGMVLRGAFGQVSVGLALGLPAAIGSGALIASRLFGVRPWDPALLVQAALLLVAATLVAAFIPARRAAGLDPIRALRIE